jgi:hypothetical protein
MLMAMLRLATRLTCFTLTLRQQTFLAHSDFETPPQSTGLTSASHPDVHLAVASVLARVDGTSQYAAPEETFAALAAEGVVMKAGRAVATDDAFVVHCRRPAASPAAAAASRGQQRRHDGRRRLFDGHCSYSTPAVSSYADANDDRG